MEKRVNKKFEEFANCSFTKTACSVINYNHEMMEKSGKEMKKSTSSPKFPMKWKAKQNEQGREKEKRNKNIGRKISKTFSFHNFPSCS